jgi:DNA-binding Xre family transcriptional regulator
MAEKKINQTQLAEEAGLNRATVNRLFNDTCRRVDFDTLEKLATYFDCKLTDILDFDKA